MQARNVLELAAVLVGENELVQSGIFNKRGDINKLLDKERDKVNLLLKCLNAVLQEICTDYRNVPPDLLDANIKERVLAYGVAATYKTVLDDEDEALYWERLYCNALEDITGIKTEVINPKRRKLDIDNLIIFREEQK